MNTGYVQVDDADEIAAIQTYALHAPIGYQDAAGQWWATPHSLAAYREWKKGRAVEETCAHAGGVFGASDGHNYCLICDAKLSNPSGDGRG